jgi:hypothetical protein
MSDVEIKPPAGPTKLNMLVTFLGTYPSVRITGLHGDVEDGEFTGPHPAGLFFRRPDGSERFVSLLCRRGRAWESGEGIKLDPGGFEIEKFGRTIRVEYLGRRV